MSSHTKLSKKFNLMEIKISMSYFTTKFKQLLLERPQIQAPTCFQLLPSKKIEYIGRICADREMQGSVMHKNGSNDTGKSDGTFNLDAIDGGGVVIESVGKMDG